MSLSFFAVTYIYPLVLIPLAAAYVYILHREKKKNNKTVIPSVLVLKLIHKQVELKKKNRLPLRGIIELLLLLIFILILSHPRRNSDEKKIALLLDNSLSTAAQTSNRISVFDSLKHQLVSYIKDFTEVVNLTLYTTSGERKIFSIPSQLTEFERYVTNITPQLKEDNIEERVELILDGKEVDSIGIFSDKQLPEKIPDGYTFPLSRVSPLKDNLALSNINYDRVTNTVTATIISFTNKPATVKVIVLTEGGKRYESENYQIGKFASSTLRVPIHNKYSGPLKASLKILPQSNFQDSISADNEIYYYATQDKLKVGVYSTTALDKLGLNNIDTYDFLKIENDINDFSKFAGLILYNINLDSLPPVNTLQIKTPQNTKHTETISFWARSHEVTRYIDFSNILLPGKPENEIPSWGIPLIQTSSDTFLWEASKSGRRYIFSNIELLPLGKMEETRATSILFLNICKYLFNSNLSVSNPNNINADSAYLWNGEYRKYNKDKKNHENGLIISEDKRSVLETNNFFSPKESNLLDNGILNLREYKSKLISSEKHENSELILLLCTVLILFLILDHIYLWNRRRK